MDRFEINKLTDGPHTAIDFKKIADGGAVRIAARPRRAPIKLQVQLKTALAKTTRQFLREEIIPGNSHAIGIEQDVIDLRMVLQPGEQFEKLWVKRRFTARKLQDFNSAFALDNALNPLLQ